MHDSPPPGLTPDEIDDVLWLTRVHEVEDLQSTLTELSARYRCQQADILLACVDAETGNTALHHCSANGSTDVLEILLAKLGSAEVASSLVNAQNKQGNTALHWAAYNGHLTVVKSLLSGGADMWIKNAAGHLALFEAERAEKPEVVQYLLEAGGKEVERTGRVGQSSAEDEVDVQDGAANGNGSFSNEQPGEDVDMAATGS